MRPHARINCAWALVLLLAPLAAHAETYFGFQLGIKDAPPPPLITFQNVPRMVVVPSTRVTRVTDPACKADLFRFGGTWYAYAAQHWYRADDVSGPYRVLDARKVPRAVLFVPPMHWKHHPQRVQPGLAKKNVAMGAKRVAVAREVR